MEYCKWPTSSGFRCRRNKKIGSDAVANFDDVTLMTSGQNMIKAAIDDFGGLVSSSAVPATIRSV